MKTPNIINLSLNVGIKVEMDWSQPHSSCNCGSVSNLCPPIAGFCCQVFVFSLNATDNQVSQKTTWLWFTVGWSNTGLKARHCSPTAYSYSLSNNRWRFAEPIPLERAKWGKAARCHPSDLMTSSVKCWMGCVRHLCGKNSTLRFVDETALLVTLLGTLSTLWSISNTD